MTTLQYLQLLERRIDQMDRHQRRHERRTERSLARIEAAIGTAFAPLVVPTRRGVALAAGAGAGGAGLVTLVVQGLQALGVL